MQPLDFLAAVLPSTGVYCVCAIAQRQRPHVFNETLEAISDAAAEFDKRGQDAYFALASFHTDESRTAANAAYMRSLFVDLDCGSGKQYPTKRAAVEALAAFLQASGLDSLGQPWLVDSGGGVHAYWPLDADAAITQWKPVAEALKRTAKVHGFEMDWTVPADAARVLRVPGTHNYKYGEPKLVAVRHRGDTFSLEAIAKTLGATAPAPAQVAVRPAQEIALLPGQAPQRTQSATAVKLVEDSVVFFKKILQRSLNDSGCGQLKYYVEHAQDDGMEPLWRGLLSIAHKCEDGAKAAQKLSAMHPYEPERLERKWIEIKGPYPCTKFDSENPGICPSCKHWGKITNPLTLGREVVETPERTFTQPSEDSGAPLLQYKLPAPPIGYKYGADAVYRIESDADGNPIDKMILPRLMFLDTVLQEDDAFYARFCCPSQDMLTFIIVPTKSVASKDDTIKQLANQNIFAAYGSGNDKHLFDFVRASVLAASSTPGAALRVPPKYGWQPDGAFAFADVVTGINGEYTFASNKLSNLIDGMRPRGTLADWQRIMATLCRKGLWEIVALGCIGFGSPLMRWSTNGAEAMVFHAGSRESGVGKSLALSLARSVWGGPRYSVVPKTSENTMLQRAGFLGGLPLLVDEVTNKNRNADMEWIPNFIFDYSQGQHKLKGSGSANAELNDNMNWAGLAFITSNSPVMEHMLGSRETSSNGEVQRFLEWRSERRIEFTTEEREVISTLQQNYGTAGPAFARWLVNNQDVAREMYAKVTQNWRNEIQASDAERFWVAGPASIITATILLGPKYANLCQIDPREIAKVFREIIAYTRVVMKETTVTASDMLNAFTREHNGELVKIAPSSNGIAVFGNGTVVKPDSAKGRIAGRVEHEMRKGWIDYYIDIPTLRRFCSARNWSYIDLKRELMHHATVREVRRDLLAGTNGARLHVTCLHVAYPVATPLDP
jgi:hypothetical protein